MTGKIVSFSTTDKDRKLIFAEQRRLESQGQVATISAAIRSLIFRASPRRVKALAEGGGDAANG
jgi:hypothetical protein